MVPVLMCTCKRASLFAGLCADVMACMWDVVLEPHHTRLQLSKCSNVICYYYLNVFRCSNIEHISNWLIALTEM